MAEAVPQAFPVKAIEVTNLIKVGIKQDSVKFKTVTMESEKFICIREETDNKVAILEVDNPQHVLRLPGTSTSAIMNPVAKVIGLRVDNNLQIFNLDLKTKMKATQLPEPVVFWKWIDTKTLSIVTEKSVFHWSMEGDKNPEKIFDRSPHPVPVQVLNYRSSRDGKWLFLNGIAQSQTTQGAIDGVLQLYSVERKVSQPTLNAPAACFGDVKINGRQGLVTVFCFTHQTPAATKLTIVEVGQAEQKFKMAADIPFADKDFAVALLCDEQHSMVYCLSKAGYLFLFDVNSGKCLFGRQVSKHNLFIACTHDASGGVQAIDLSGRVVRFLIDEQNVVPYVATQLRDPQLATQLAVANNWPGAEATFKQQFDQLIATNQIPAAIKLAVEAPRGILRTSETIAIFQRAPPVDGRPAFLAYFRALLEKGKLNKEESIKLCEPLVEKGATKPVEEWLKQDKLEHSEQLGDLLKKADIRLAASVYLHAKCTEKVVGCFLQLGEFDKLIAYAKSVNFTPDYALLLQQLHRLNPESARRFASLLVSYPEGPKLEFTQALNIFMAGNDVAGATAIILEYLKKRGDKAEDAPLQTKLLEINLLAAPQVADAIMESEEYKFTHYDKKRIAQLCERVQLFQRALENYTDLEDIKRVLLNAGLMKPAFVVSFMGTLTADDCIDCLRHLLKTNLQQHLMLVVEVAKTYAAQLGLPKLTLLFEEFKSYNGLYYFLGAIVNASKDPDVVFKYLEAAARLNQLTEVERICREHEHYDPIKVKEFLIKMNLKDPRALIHLCDRHGFVEELTRYLHQNQMLRFLEVYVQKMSPHQAPIVIGTLLDLNANDQKLAELVMSLPPPQPKKDLPAVPHCPIKELCDEVEKRGRLVMLQPWLEARAAEGNESEHLHNALAKIYVEKRQNPQQFLTTNKFYDSAVVGAFCESRDPHLSLLCYKRAGGKCDKELIALTTKHAFFKDQARYLVERQNAELWESVLKEESPARRSLIDQVVATALPESKIPEEVSAAVQAFMKANLPNELIELLEKIVLHGPRDSAFRSNRNLQNLLILTAIKADKKRVMDYINRLDNYDGAEIAKIAVSDQYKLYEEAFVIYQKAKRGADAIKVLLQNIQNLDRAADFADVWNEPAVWGILAVAQLEAAKVQQAIASFLKADDATQYEKVIPAAEKADAWEPLIQFLKMARGKMREPLVDNELCVAYARTSKLAELEELLAGPNVARLEDVGDQCFDKQMYEAARILFAKAANYAKLALCYVHLGKFLEAVEAARKANSIPTWKAVCFACVDAKEFRLAQVCGAQIIGFAEHLNEVIRHYETYGYFNEAISLLEAGMGSERAHQGLFTQLGILYAKYKEDALPDHIKYHWQKINIPPLLQVCKEQLQWVAVVMLYTHYDQFDNAAETLIAQSAFCWTHERFKEVLAKCSSETYFKAAQFYASEHPLLLSDLLIDMAAQLDHTRIVSLMAQDNLIPLIAKYLLQVQRENVPAVNEALNNLFVEEEDYEALRKSIDTYDKFESLPLAKRLEKHELLQFRRIAAYLYKKNERWGQSMELSKKDKLYQDAMETAASSKDPELAENLLRFFVDNNLRDSYAAMLYNCYDLIKPDVVQELSWRFKLQDESMPYIIQHTKDTQDWIVQLKDKVNKLTAPPADAANAEAKTDSATDAYGQQLAITDGSARYAPAQPQGPYGAPPPMMVPPPMGYPQPPYPPQM